MKSQSYFFNLHKSVQLAFILADLYMAGVYA